MEDYLLACPNCGEETVFAVTQATHTSSDYIEVTQHGYRAWNTDESWKIVENTEKFVCDSCEHTWPVDKNITWEWVD